jgi:hypothetical protein
MTARALRTTLVAALCAGLSVAAACGRGSESSQRTFATPEDAVRALTDAVKGEQLDAVFALFGPDGRDLVDTSDPATARQNRQIFTAAMAERWRLTDQDAQTKILLVGYEDWPFPIPLARNEKGWRFDTAAGREEVIARRIGRNELAAIQACRTFVVAQRLYARVGHDGKSAGLYAATFRSDPGRQNGLYWPATHGARRSPLGVLLADAADVRRNPDGKTPSPYRGYYFRILTAQGANAPGGAKNYVVNGDLKDGFALVAWPATYDVTGVMTFLLGPDATIREKDLGADTASAAAGFKDFNPDASWAIVQ